MLIHVDAAADGGAWVVPNSADSNSPVTVTYGAYSPYEISHVYADGVEVAATGDYTFDAAGDHTLFVYSTCTTTVTTGHDTGGYVDPAGTVAISPGGSLTCTYWSIDDYYIVGAAIDGGSVDYTYQGQTSGEYTFSGIYGEHSIYVSFSNAPLTTPTPDPSATPTPSPSPTPPPTGTPTYQGLTRSTSYANASCQFNATFSHTGTGVLEGGGECQFESNVTGVWIAESAVAFTATPQNASITKLLNDTVGSVIAYRWNMTDADGNKNSTGILTFTTLGFTITPSNDSYSTTDPAVPTVVCYNGTQAFTFSASDGYSIGSVIINGVYQAATTSPYTFTYVTGNSTIAVSTSATLYYIDATSDAGCVLYPHNNPQTLVYAEGSTASFTCTAYPGYQVQDLIVNGSSAGPVASYSFSPTGNMTLYLTSSAVTTGGGGGGSTTVIQQFSAYPTAEPEPAPKMDLFAFTAGTIGIVVITGAVLIGRSGKKRGKAGGEWT